MIRTKAWLSGARVMSLNKPINVVLGYPKAASRGYDVYFSADVETDGPIPGPFSMLSFGLVYAGAYDGTTFYRPPEYLEKYYVELRPISDAFEREALAINGIDRDSLVEQGADPTAAMTDAAGWVRQRAGIGAPVIVAYPLSFDWMWLYWYFMRFSTTGSPFAHSRGFDIKTAISIKLRRMISKSGRSRIPEAVRSSFPHTHNALDDAIEQAEIFANIFAMEEGRE